MAITYYAGNRIAGLTADTKPTNVLDGALFFELDEKKRVFEMIGGVWEELIGEDIEVVNSIEIDEGKIRLVGDEENPGNNKVYGTNASGERTWKDDPSGGGGGEANTASNVGGAVGLFLEKVGVDLRFRTIEAGDNITFDLSDPNKVVINGEAGGGGGGGIDAITTETTGSNTTVTTSNAAMHVLRMTGDLTATIADFPESSKTHRFILKVIQDGSGGRTLTIAGNVLFPSGSQPSNSESAGAFDLYEFVWDGTNWLLDNKTSAYS